MIHSTRGIVLKTVKYGETSVIATIYTEKFGLQSYIVNGVRQLQKKQGKAIMLQPGALLDLDVYHQELKNLQRIKECSWSYIYRNVFSDIIKNSIAVFMIELMLKLLKEPENNPDLFYFCEDALMHLDEAETAVMVNYALYFALHLPYFFGFRIQPPALELYSGEMILDLKEGFFTHQKPEHRYFLEQEEAIQTGELLKALHPHELVEIKIHHVMRRRLLDAYLDYYALHMPDFGEMRSLNIMREVISG